MLKKSTLILIILSIFNTHYVKTALSAKSLIKTDGNFTPIESLNENDSIINLELKSGKISSSFITHFFIRSSQEIYEITTPESIISCTEKQFFYDPIKKSWIAAKNLSNKNYFLDSNFKTIACLNVKKINFDEPIMVYEITLKAPHTFFVSKSQILTHNVIPIVIGISWTIGEGIALAGVGAGIGTLGLGLWQKFGKNQKITFAQIEQECRSSYTGGPPEDQDDPRKKNNLSKTDFFKKIKNKYTHWKNGIYKRNPNTPGIENAEYLKWDHLHNDVEAYCKNKKHLGSINPRTLELYKQKVYSRTLGH